MESQSRSASPTKSISVKSTARRPRRATTSAAEGLSLPPTEPISFVMNAALAQSTSSTMSSRRAHIPPRLSLSSTALGSSRTREAVASPATSAVWTLPPTPMTSGTQSPLTPPITPASVTSSYYKSSQSQSYNQRPMSTATSSSSHTVKVLTTPRPGQLGSITPTSPAVPRASGRATLHGRDGPISAIGDEVRHSRHVTLFRDS